MPRAKKTKSNTNIEVESLRHNADMRKNIPTSELRDFVSDAEIMPPTMLYPRDLLAKYPALAETLDKELIEAIEEGIKKWLKESYYHYQPH